MPASDQPVLEVEFKVEKEEYRGLILRFTYAEDYGIWRIFLDGKNVRQPDDYMAGQKIQDFDFYSKDLEVKDNYLGSFKLAPGKHTLRLECRGRNPCQRQLPRPGFGPAARTLDEETEVPGLKVRLRVTPVRGAWRGSKERTHETVISVGLGGAGRSSRPADLSQVRPQPKLRLSGRPPSRS